MTFKGMYNHLVISEPIRCLAERIYRLYREKQPVSASLCGPVQWDGVEDLSDHGLMEYSDGLMSLATEVSIIRRESLNLTERVVAEEMERFVQEKLYQTSVQQLYQTRLMPYFQLIAASLLPFSLSPPMSEATDGRLYERLHNAVVWLNLAATRQESGSIVASAEDVVAAQRLANAISEFILRKENISSRISDLAEELCSLLKHWAVTTEGSVTSKGTLRLDNLEHLLYKCFGTGKSVSEWATILTDRLLVELDDFAQTEKGEGNFHSLGQITDWNFASEWGVELDIETKINDPAGVLQWFHSIYRLLRIKTEGTFLQSTAPIARIEVGQSLLSFLATEVLYLPLSERGQEARMLVSPMLVNRTGSLTCRFRLHMALAIAHDLCPGHHEHVWRRTEGVFGSYIDCIQSSVGLEGWGVFAESILADLSPKGALEMQYSRIRRLMPSAVTLTLMDKGRNVANNLLQNIAKHYPSIINEGVRFGGGLGWASLPYAVGLIETETALKQMRTSSSKVEPFPRITERYLAQGPITPSLAVLLATQSGEKREENNGFYREISTNH
ncbi:hypothetical protein NKT34_08715 [Paenibacillus polysaccharolyticus]|uniref:hypothetical protein n=1 Tax=Paenibacillus polysaccharolyticus TaxID=582692 RepID=UPI00209CA29A|nr:hypothetical protein [Paenibacillus polysaccharolyticus]MCP1133370.1 hypothetical protein [Paenibacillus polysaccharolyticus]